MLDRLLPANRDLTGSGGHHQQPYHRDVDALNEALLLVPPEGVTDWPWTRTMESGARWIAAFTGHAGLADRVITFVGKLLGLRSDLAISLVLRVLGNDVKPIRRQSQYTVAFLHAALRDPRRPASTSSAPDSAGSSPRVGPCRGLRRACSVRSEPPSAGNGVRRRIRWHPVRQARVR